MRVISWNIRNGGGKSVDGILKQLQVWNPDVAGLQEFRGMASSKKISSALHELGLVYQVSTVDPVEPRWNRLLLASRIPFVTHEATGVCKESGRWLHVTLETPDSLQLMVMHVLNRFEGHKYKFQDEVIETFQSMRTANALAFGDTNTGVPHVDEEAMYFLPREGEWFDRIREAGWEDVWRARNPETREFTWYTHGGSGFRQDQLFATGSMAKRVTDIRYDWGQPETETGRTMSDHAAIVFDIEMSVP